MPTIAEEIKARRELQTAQATAPEQYAKERETLEELRAKRAAVEEAQRVADYVEHPACEDPSEEG